MKNKYTAVIIEDEIDNSDFIKLLLRNEFPNIEVKYLGKSISDAVIYLSKEEHPDILFLDVQLRDGVIFDLFDKIPADDISSQIIFITAYDRFAIPAIKTNAIDYLLKPLRPVDFVLATKKAIKNISQHTPAVELPVEVKKEAAIPVSSNGVYVNLPTLNGFIRTKISDIVYCEADANYSTIVLVNGDKVVTSKNLKEYERVLPTTNFFRIHHKYMINTDYLTEYLKGKGGQVVLQNKYTLDVSVRRKSELLEYLM